MDQYWFTFQGLGIPALKNRSPNFNWLQRFYWLVSFKISPTTVIWVSHILFCKHLKLLCLDILLGPDHLVPLLLTILRKSLFCWAHWAVSDYWSFLYLEPTGPDPHLLVGRGMAEYGQGSPLLPRRGLFQKLSLLYSAYVLATSVAGSERASSVIVSS